MAKCKVRSFSCPDYIGAGLDALAHDLSMSNGSAIIQHCIMTAFREARSVPECGTALKIFNQTRATNTLREGIVNEETQTESTIAKRTQGGKGAPEGSGGPGSS